MSENKKLVPKRRFKEFENTDVWKQSELGEVLSGMYNGQTPSRFSAENWGGKINWLTSGELNQGVVMKTIEKITPIGQKDANLRVVPEGTFIMAITGLEAAGTRGSCARLGIPTTLNQSCMALFPKENLLDSGFLFQWYKKIGESYGLKYTQGTKQQSYNAELVKILPIILPNVAEQKEISNFLDNLDQTIAFQQRKLEKMKSMKSAYLSEMFPAEGERKPKRRFPGFTDDWEQRKLGEVSKLRGGFAFQSGNFKSNGIPIVRISNILPNGNIGGDFAYYDEQEKDINYLLPNKAVLLAMSGATTGKVSILKNPQNIKIYQNQRVGFFMNDDKAEYSYISTLVKSEIFLNQLNSVLVAGAQPNISSKEVENFEFNFPTSREEQQKIGKFFENIDQTIAFQQQKLEKLQNIKKAYLNEMFI